MSTSNILEIKLIDGRIVKVLDPEIKRIINIEKTYGDEYVYLTNEEIQHKLDSEIKIYMFLSLLNIQNEDILTDYDKKVIKAYQEAFDTYTSRFESFDSDVACCNDLLSCILNESYVSIW